MGALELKGSQLVKTPVGRQRATRVIDGLLTLGAEPVFSVNEKRYAVAGKIVQTFIDPPYNDNVRNYAITWHRGMNQLLAERLYTMPPGSLDGLWDSIRIPDADAMKQQLEFVVRRCELLGRDGLAFLLRGSFPYVRKIVEELDVMRDDPIHRHSMGLAATCLWGLLAPIDSVATAAGLSELAVRHDETHSFGPLLNWWFATVRRNGQVREDVYPEGLRVRHGLAAFSTFEQVNSKNEPLIQAADVLAAVMGAVPSHHVEFLGTNPDLVDLYAGMAAGSLEGYPNPRRFLGSISFLESVMAPISAAMERFDAAH